MKTKSVFPSVLFLLIGILSAAVYFTAFYRPDKASPLLLIGIKLCTNTAFIAFAFAGVRKNRSLRNRTLIAALLFYATGDILCIFSVPVGGILYFVGHLLIIHSLYISTLIRKKNIVVYIIIAISGTLFLLFMFKNNLASSVIYIAYGLIINIKLALAINDPLYLAASAVFAVSDILGVYRVMFYGVSSAAFYIVTLGIYYLAIVLYSLTAYQYEAKPVVTWSNMTVLARNLNRGGVRFCFTQGWGRDIAAGRYLAMHSDAYIAADINDREKAEKVLSRMEYKMTDCFAECGVYVYFSELFGFLNISFRRFTDDGVILGRREYAIKNCSSVFLRSGIPAIAEQKNR